MILIGLNGPARSGKDTAFTAIQKWADERGVVAVRRGFADALKWSAARIFWPECTMEEGVRVMNAWKENAIEGRAQRGSYAGYGMEYLTLGIPSRNAGSMFSPEPTVPTVRAQIDGRTFLQRYGTEAHRDVFGDDFWLDALLPKGLSLQKPLWHRQFAGADIAVITDLRFANEARRVIHLGGQVWEIERVDVEREGGHISETKLPEDLIDHTVVNGFGVEEYIKTIRTMCDTYIHLEN